MTTALYRRYRPETFAEVVGQDHVTGPLRQALRTGQTNHAYLFSGPRGCGKTTSARILARCLNCAQGPTDTPCGVCESCVELARGGPGSLDVVEIDAASHGGVDDARDLRERATFAPARDRYKVFILDEAHMVSPQGFNALLKIVEEPPEHVKFIFATTEPDKVIGTIRSRTHHYPFRLVPPDVMVDYLDQLCRAEGVQVGSGVLPLVVRAGGGSVRDSLSVLDQLIAGSGPEGLDYEAAVALLGYTHASLLDDLVEAVAARDGASAFRVVERVISTGHEPRRFVEDLLERLRDLIVLAASGDAAAAVLRDVPGDQLARMQAQAAHLGAAELSRSADLVNTALTEMTGATSPRLHLELLMARLLLPALDDSAAGLGARLDRLERDGVRAGGAPASTGGQGAGSAAARPGTEAFTPAAPVERVAVVTPPAAPAQDHEGSSAAPSGVAAASAPTRSETQRPETQRPDAGRPDTGRPDTERPVTERPGTASSEAPAPIPDREAATPAAAPATPAARPAAPPPTDDAVPSGAAPASADDASGDTSWPDVPAPGGRTPAETPAGEDPSEDPEPGAPAAAAHDVPVAEPVAPVERPVGAPGGGDTEVLRRRWPEVLDTLGRLKKTTWVLISQNAQVVELDATTLRLGFAAPGLASAFRAGPHAELVQQAVRETLGFSVKVEPVLAGPGSAPARSAEPQGPAPSAGRGGAPSAAEAAASWDAPAPAPRSASDAGARASHGAPTTGAAPDGAADDDPDGAGASGGPDDRDAPEQDGAPWRTPAGASTQPSAPATGVGVPAVPAAPSASDHAARSASGDAHRPASGGGDGPRDARRPDGAGHRDGTGHPDDPGRPDVTGQPHSTGVSDGAARPATPPPWDADPDDPGAPEPPPEEDWAPAPPSGADRVRAAARAAAAGGAGAGGRAAAAAAVPRVTWADDEPSMDDPDIGSSGLSGVPLLAQMLGATVVEESDDRPF